MHHVWRRKLISGIDGLLPASFRGTLRWAPQIAALSISGLGVVLVGFGWAAGFAFGLFGLGVLVVVRLAPEQPRRGPSLNIGGRELIAGVAHWAPQIALLLGCWWASLSLVAHGHSGAGFEICLVGLGLLLLVRLVQEQARYGWTLTLREALRLANESGGDRALRHLRPIYHARRASSDRPRATAIRLRTRRPLASARRRRQPRGSRRGTSGSDADSSDESDSEPTDPARGRGRPAGSSPLHVAVCRFVRECARLRGCPQSQREVAEL